MLIYMCFMIVCNHMPHLIPAIYDGIFEIVSFPAFLFLIGAFVGELVILKKWVNKRTHYYVLFALIFIFSSIMLFHGHASLYDKLRPTNNTTLLGRPTAGPHASQSVFLQYYFDNKNVVIPEEVVAEKENLPYIFMLSVSPNQVREGESIDLPENIEDILLSHPHNMFKSIYCVIDEYWGITDTIRLVISEDKYIFCSQELLEEIEKNGGQQYSSLRAKDYETDEMVSLLSNIKMAEPYKKLKQIFVMSLLFVVGLLIALPIWGEKYPALAVCLSLPISAASLCLGGMVMMAFHIPYNLYSIAFCSILLVGIWSFKERNVYQRLGWSVISNYILIALGIIIALTYAEICFTTHDSIVKGCMGYRLAKFGSLNDILYYAAPYGMLEPMVLAVGYMARCDFLYTFYPLMIISGLGLMCAGLYYISNKKNSRLSIMVLFGGIVLLLSNYDFLLSTFYAMAHGPIAVYMLILTMFMIMKKQMNVRGFEYATVLSASMIALTRVEGAVYVLFILIASLGLENEYLKLKRVIVMIASITIMWNSYQMVYIGQSESTLFWTPTRGYLLSGASIIAVIFMVCYHQSWRFVENIKKNFYQLLIMIMVGGTGAAILMERSMASVNMPTYLAHFSNNIENDTNSASLWIFVFLLFPVALSAGTRTSKYAVTTVCGYLMLIYVICLFRYEGDDPMPLRRYFGDSARRTIVQIMPTAVWLISYCMSSVEQFAENEKKVYGKKIQKQ